MSSILAVAFPVFAVIAAGLAAGRLRAVSAEDSAALNRFVFRFAMPAALFGLMSGAHGLQPADGILAIAYGAPALFVLTAAYFIGRRLFSLARPEAGAHAFASTIGNAVFLGLPIALAIEGWARPFVVLMLVEGILLVGAGAALMTAREQEKNAGPLRAVGGFLARPFKTPIVAAAFAGFALASIGVSLPGPVQSFFDILGRAAGPSALFSLGLFLATHPLPPLKTTAGKIAAVALMKMIALPLLAFAAGRLLGVDDRHYLAALVLFTVTPTAVGAFVMASQYGYYVRETVSVIAATTMLSVLTISAALALFA